MSRRGPPARQRRHGAHTRRPLTAALPLAGGFVVLETVEPTYLLLVGDAPGARAAR